MQHIHKDTSSRVFLDFVVYFGIQVEKRCMEVWGSKEALDEAKESREENKELQRQKRFNKKVKGWSCCSGNMHKLQTRDVIRA